MYCSHCGAQNSDSDLFCGSCGQKLSGGSTAGPAAAPDDELPPVMDSRAEFAMLRPPESEMRPLTKLAYDIRDSEQAKAISAVLSVIFVGLCLGVIANLLAIFEKMNNLTYPLKTSTGTKLSDEIYSQLRGDSTMDLIWLCVLFASLVLLYIVVGKIKLRLKKIYRKEKKFKAKGLFIDI